MTGRAGCPASSTAGRTRSTSAAGVSLWSSVAPGSAASPWGSSTWRHASASRCGRVCGVDDVDEVVRGKRAVRKKTPVGEKEVNTRGLLEREPLGSDKPERAVGERSPSERKTRDISVGERGP